MLELKEALLLKGVRSDLGWDLVKTFSVTRREEPEEVRRGAELLIERITASGLALTVHDPELYLGLPVETTVEVGGHILKAKAAAGSPETFSFTEKLVYLPARNAGSRVHTNDPAQLFGDEYTLEHLRITVAGRVVLTDGLSNPARSELLEKLGACAIITINPGDSVHWGASAVVWGSPGTEQLELLPTIPSIAVARADGATLIHAAKEGVDVRIAVKTMTGWFRQPIPEVRIKGSEDGEEFVMVHGHYDAWDVGVGDNATGDAVLLEVARALHRHPPRRSVRILWWPGHSAGRYAGSTWYADAFAHDLRDHCIAHLNCDSPGCRDATDYQHIRGMSEAATLVAGAVKDLFNQDCKLERPGRAGDYSFNNLGISGAMLTSSMVPQDERKRRGWYSVGGNGGSPTWHTEFDQLEVADRAVIENDARLYTLLAWRVAEPEIPPLDYRKPLFELRQQFDSDFEAASGAVDLSMHWTLFNTLQERVEALYTSHFRSQVEVRRVAQAQKALGRSVVRIGYSIGAPFIHDAALALPALPLLSHARSSSRNDPAVRTTLQRNANALLAELRGAIKACEV